MAGLVPAIHVVAAATASRTLARTRSGWVYIMTNRPNGTLYTSVSADIARRAFEHRESLCEGFTKQYAPTRLVWYEAFENIAAAIQRESVIKHWPHAWKVRMTLSINSNWRDLYLDLNN